MKLKNYLPASNEILLELREYNGGVVITVTPQHDKVMKVIAVGPTVTAINPHTSKVVAPGDFVIVGASQMPQLEFEAPEKGQKKIIALQCKEFSIMSYYLPDQDETKYWIDYQSSGIESIEQDKSREMNIIDNPGIEKGSYLKEEKDNQRKLKLQD